MDPRTPILVGCGQITDTTGKPSGERSNVAFCAEAAGIALADTGAAIGAAALGRKIDTVAVLEFFPDISPRFASPLGRCSNPPKAVANRLAAAPRQLLYTYSGGNMPQYLVNRFAEEIASGETELALVCGAELLRSTQNARKAMKEIGLADDDPRPISVTGGLPFFGGPGNNYVTHSIAEMMNVVRKRPGSFGMVTANGNYLTKHSAGLYSTEPTKGPWRREDPKKFQAELDQRPKQRVNTTPAGTGTVETYCVAYGKDAPEKAYILGRLDGSGDRFVAMTGNDPALLADMLTKEQLGRKVSVAEKDGRNVFHPI